MDFLSHREGGIVLYQALILSPLQCRVMTVEISKWFHEFEDIH
jgi:hypothetical protein